MTTWKWPWFLVEPGNFQWKPWVFASEVDRIQWSLRDLQETMGKTNEKKGGFL
jgi:hypothetical protein